MGKKFELFSIRAGLLHQQITAYDAEGAARKCAFQRDARALLKQLAKLLGLSDGTYEIRVNAAGLAGSGEVTLHGERLYLQVYESHGRPGVSVLYRSCRGRTDYTGGTNHFVSAQELTLDEQQRKLINTCRALILPKAA